MSPLRKWAVTIADLWGLWLLLIEKLYNRPGFSFGCFNYAEAMAKAKFIYFLITISLIVLSKWC